VALAGRGRQSVTTRRRGGLAVAGAYQRAGAIPGWRAVPAVRYSVTPYIPPWVFERTRLQNVRLKNLSFLAKPKIDIFACFFAQT
jgi:hypothetical protein